MKFIIKGAKKKTYIFFYHQWTPINPKRQPMKGADDNTIPIIKSIVPNKQSNDTKSIAKTSSMMTSNTKKKKKSCL